MTLHNESKPLQAKVPDYASIDLRRDKLLCVSEAGEGRLMTVQRNTDSSDCLSPGRYRREFVFKPHPTEFRVTPASINNVSIRKTKAVAH